MLAASDTVSMGVLPCRAQALATSTEPVAAEPAPAPAPALDFSSLIGKVGFGWAWLLNG